MGRMRVPPDHGLVTRVLSAYFLHERGIVGFWLVRGPGILVRGLGRYLGLIELNIVEAVISGVGQRQTHSGVWTVNL